MSWHSGDAVVRLSSEASGRSRAKVAAVGQAHLVCRKAHTPEKNLNYRSESNPHIAALMGPRLAALSDYHSVS